MHSLDIQNRPVFNFNSQMFLSTFLCNFCIIYPIILGRKCARDIQWGEGLHCAEKIEALLGKEAIDGRLTMQYAVSLVCAEEVC